MWAPCHLAMNTNDCKALKGHTDDLENRLTLRNLKVVGVYKGTRKESWCIFLQIVYDCARNEWFEYFFTVHFSYCILGKGNLMTLYMIQFESSFPASRLLFKPNQFCFSLVVKGIFWFSTQERGNRPRFHVLTWKIGRLIFISIAFFPSWSVNQYLRMTAGAEWGSSFQRMKPV